MALPTIAEIEAAADTNPCCTPDPQRALWDIIGILIELYNRDSEFLLLNNSTNTYTVADNYEVILAPGAGFRLRVRYLNVSNKGSAGGSFYFDNTDGTQPNYANYLAPGGIWAHNLVAGEFDLPEDTGLVFSTVDELGEEFFLTVSYQIIPV